MLKNADAVADLPSETAYPQEKNYFAVPFLQMVLHGIVEYAHAPANTSENTETAVLRALEYGALPSYNWSFTKTEIAELDERFKSPKPPSNMLLLTNCSRICAARA